VLALLLTAVLVAAPQASPTMVGARAPDLEAVTLEGKAIVGGWSRGDATVVVFFATWCKPCHRTLQELGSIRQTIGPRLRFVLIDAGDDSGEVRRFVAENPVPEGAVVVTDLANRDRLKWGCHIYPTLFIVDRLGIVRYINRGWGEGSMAKYLRRIHNVLGESLPSFPGENR
jgi:cytochrome c biogenesis protein CcmG, thiol:disulfide interchange protein DsbE